MPFPLTLEQRLSTQFPQNVTIPFGSNQTSFTDICGCSLTSLIICYSLSNSSYRNILLTRYINVFQMLFHVASYKIYRSCTAFTNNPAYYHSICHNVLVLSIAGYTQSSLLNGRGVRHTNLSVA